MCLGERASRRRAQVPRAQAENLREALAAGFDEVIAVVRDPDLAAELPEDVTVLLDESAQADEASALRVAADWCARSGHDRLVVALAAARVAPTPVWSLLEVTDTTPVLLARDARGAIGVVRLDASVWSLLPLSGGVDALWRARRELVTEVLVTREPTR